MNRQQAAVAMAIIIRVSKEINSHISTDTLEDIIIDVPDIMKAKKYGLNIEKYFKSNSCEPFIPSIDRIYPTGGIWKYITTANDVDSNAYRILKDFAMVVDNIKSYSEVFKEAAKQKKFENLTDELSNDKALEVMQRAVDSNLLSDNFQLNDSLTRHQVRVLAYALAKTIGLPPKKTYVVFERQWHIDERLAWANIAEEDTSYMDVIKMVFPDVDYDALVRPNSNAFFIVNFDDEKILSLFMSLLTHGYIDRATSFVEFKKVFGRGDLSERTPVNWVKSQKLLSIFVYVAFNNIIHNCWQKTKNCFVVNGKMPLMGSLRANMGKVLRNGAVESTDPLLYGIAQTFAHEMNFGK